MSSSRSPSRNYSRSPSQNYSRSPSHSYSGYGSSSSSPRKSHSNVFLDYIYEPKTYNILVILSIFFFLVILSFSFCEIPLKGKSPKCKCASNQYHKDNKCVDFPEGFEFTTNLESSINKLFKDNCTIHYLRENDKLHLDQLSDDLFYSLLSKMGYFVDDDGTIHSCKVQENLIGYEIVTILLFAICLILSILSFLGQRSKL